MYFKASAYSVSFHMRCPEDVWLGLRATMIPNQNGFQQTLVCFFIECRLYAFGFSEAMHSVILSNCEQCHYSLFSATLIVVLLCELILKSIQSNLDCKNCGIRDMVTPFEPNVQLSQ